MEAIAKHKRKGTEYVVVERCKGGLLSVSTKIRYPQEWLVNEENVEFLTPTTKK